METSGVPSDHFFPLNAWPWGLLTAVVATLCAMVVQSCAGALALHPLRRAGVGHWTERARLAYPVSVTLGLGQILQPFLWVAITTATVDWHPLGSQPWMGLLVGLAVFAGVGFVSARMESRARARVVTMPDWLRGWAVLALLFLAPLIVSANLLWGLPSSLDWTVGWMVLVVAITIGVLSFGGAVVLARAVGLLVPATERLHSVARSSGPPPRLHVLRWRMANAVAFPLCRTIAVTDTALATLSDSELAAIYAHEQAHLDEPRRIQLARLAGQFQWLPLFLIKPVSGTFGLTGVATAFALVLLAHSLIRRMTYRMELRADSRGKDNEGDPGTYARALERLYEVNLLPAVTRIQRPTHPHLYDRLLAAGVTPDYARPALPSRWRARLALLFSLAATLSCVLLWIAFLRGIAPP